MSKKLLIAGHDGMVGKSLLNRFKSEDYEVIFESKDKLNFLNFQETSNFLKANKPELIFVAAARVGGISANESYPVNFLNENLMIAANIINAAHINDINQLIFLGSSCIYPKESIQPIKEESLLTGSLEPTNQWYSIAKISGIKLCEAYRKQYDREYFSIQPTNLYGPNDNFNFADSHVIPGMIHKIHMAKKDKKDTVKLWGTGNPLREFLYVDDLSDALFFIEKNKIIRPLINIGSNQEIQISELAFLIAKIIGFEGKIDFDRSMPDGMKRKKLDLSIMNSLGWKSITSLEEGLDQTYGWFLNNYESLRR